MPGSSPTSGTFEIPLRWVGPIRITGTAATGDIEVPMATFESPLWPSVARGARVSRRVDDGVRATVVDERMTRSTLFVADAAATASSVLARLHDDLPRLRDVVTGQSRFANLLGLHGEVVGNLLYVRFEFSTGDASGHNMATKASDALMSDILARYPEMRYGSVSGNYCSDKKVSAVNGILGRGRNVVADILIPGDVVAEQLRSTAAGIAELNVRKNLIGSTIAGSLRSANAHYANMLLAVYLATGQDAANIVEGSQGITHAEDRDGDLYFSCTLPNLVVGTVGNGKNGDAARNLERLGCTGLDEPGAGARRLAAIIAAAVLCGELSLMAALTNPGELMRAHQYLERNGSGQRSSRAASAEGDA